MTHICKFSAAAVAVLSGALLVGCSQSDDRDRNVDKQGKVTLREGGPLPVRPVYGVPDSELSVAAKAGDEKKVKDLIKSGAQVDARGNAEMTPLMVAAAAGHGGVVKALLDAGADPNLKDAKGQTAQQYARERGHEGVANQLERRDVDPPKGPASPTPVPKG